MIKNDKWIIEMASMGMISPFEAKLVRKVEFDSDPHGLYLPPKEKTYRPVLSYGLSSFGYDIRLSPVDFRIFRHIPGSVVDPKNFNPENLEAAKLETDKNGSFFILPAHSYGLGVAVERLVLPDSVTGICVGKGSYAGCGIIANITPAEAGWRGHLTLEFSNSSSADCRIYANEGICQILFFEGEPCGTSYETRTGKYQNQLQAVTLPRV